MTTAIRPSNPERDWEDVFPELKPDDDTSNLLWTLVNDVLYNFALFGRFGFANPKVKDLAESHALATFRNQVDSEKEINLRTVAEYLLSKKDVDVDSPEADIYYLVESGLLYHLMARIGREKPIVGHFVGRGSIENDKDADAFLSKPN